MRLQHAAFDCGSCSRSGWGGRWEAGSNYIELLDIVGFMGFKILYDFSGDSLIALGNSRRHNPIDEVNGSETTCIVVPNYCTAIRLCHF